MEDSVHPNGAKPPAHLKVRRRLALEFPFVNSSVVPATSLPSLPAWVPVVLHSALRKTLGKTVNHPQDSSEFRWQTLAESLGGTMIARSSLDW